MKADNISGQGLLDDAQLVDLMRALLETRVESTEETLIDRFGAEVQARTLDDPTLPGRMLIQLHKPSWENLFLSPSGTYRLIFHEYLWAMGEDDQNYRISSQLHIGRIDAPLPPVRSCGLSGDLEERVLDCSKPVSEGGFEELATRIFPYTDDDPLSQFDLHSFYVWRLVARTPDRKTLWLDDTSGLLWTDFDNTASPHFTAKRRCESSDELTYLKVGLNYDFRLPDTHEVFEADPMILASVLSKGPGFATAYWTGTSSGTLSYFAYALMQNGSSSIAGSRANDDYLFYRCVAETR